MHTYEQLGVKRYINAAATLTQYGGSVMDPQVLDAMLVASQSYVDIDELQRHVDERLAQLTRNAAAFVCNGAASGIVLATAAAITGDDASVSTRLPFTGGLRNEVVLPRAGRADYGYAIDLAGGHRVPYGDDTGGTATQLEAAITENTVAVFLFYYEHRQEHLPSLVEQSAIARAHGIPLIVDAAAQLPPKANLWRLTEQGADLVLFSGGKGIRGPQSSGLMVGSTGLIERVRAIASPNDGIGRPMKVGKEELVGLLTAVELYLQQDETAVLADYEHQVQLVVDAFRESDVVDVRRGFPSEAGQPMPWAIVTPKPGTLSMDAKGLAAQLLAGEPGVVVLSRDGSLQINPQTLLPGQIATVIWCLRDVLDANRVER